MVEYSIGDKVQIDLDYIDKANNNNLLGIPRHYIYGIIKAYDNTFIISGVTGRYVHLDDFPYSWKIDMIKPIEYKEESNNINIHEAFNAS